MRGLDKENMRVADFGDIEEKAISPDELVRDEPYSRSGIANMRAKTTSGSAQ
jgi:hypothetical protein